MLDQSIVDIYKVYDSLFDIKEEVEAVYTHPDMDIEHNNMRIRENIDFSAARKRPLNIDSAVMAVMDLEPYNAHIKSFAEELGG